MKQRTVKRLQKYQRRKKEWKKIARKKAKEKWKKRIWQRMKKERKSKMELGSKIRRRSVTAEDAEENEEERRRKCWKRERNVFPPKGMRSKNW